jgi:hypothetical protein
MDGARRSVFEQPTSAQGAVSLGASFRDERTLVEVLRKVKPAEHDERVLAALAEAEPPAS